MKSQLILTTLASIGSAIAGGLYANFSARVMPRLATQPEAQAIATMQKFNRNAQRAPFMIVFFGTALIGGVLIAKTLRNSERSLGDLLAASGSGLYLAGFLMTIAYHVPRNNRLAAVDANSPSAVPVWHDYLRQWTSGNTVRAGLTVVAAGALLAASAVEAREA